MRAVRTNKGDRMDRKKYVSGLVLVTLISVMAKFIYSWIEAYIQLESLSIAIILGMLLNNYVSLPDSLRPGIQYALKKLLKVGIVLMGFKISIASVMALGLKTLILVMVCVPAVLKLASFLGKRFNVEEKLAVLVGVGSSICGASAIVAMSSVIDADDRDAVVSVAIVSFLGGIGVLIYGAIASMGLGLSITEYGVWSGLSLQGVAHAIAAAFAMGDKAGEVGTIVKMTRVLMLVPMSIYLSQRIGQKNSEGHSNRAKVPVYVLLFIVMIVINSLGIVPTGAVSVLKQTSSFLILMAMTGMGLSIKFSEIFKKGKDALAMGTVLFLIISSVFLVIAKIMY
jgi:uncharacterized integral membrane protein (TIGR00698 family)